MILLMILTKVDSIYEYSRRVKYMKDIMFSVIGVALIISSLALFGYFNDTKFLVILYVGLFSLAASLYIKPSAQKQ